jgi:hypothetical protein
VADAGAARLERVAVLLRQAQQGLQRTAGGLFVG